MRTMKIFCLFLAAMGIIITGCKKDLTLFAGGYTNGDGKGLAMFTFNEGKESLELLAVADAGPNPSYFCFSEDQSLIYCLNEVDEFNRKKGGGLTTLWYDSNTGRCEKAGELLVPYGGPCYISKSADGEYLFLANYGSASVAVVKLGKSGLPEKVVDSILYETDTSNVSHPHMIQQDPAGKNVYVTDLGLDRIVIYTLDTNTGRLTMIEEGLVETVKGSGPRHFVFSPDGTKLYLINELSSTMMVYDVDEKGRLNLRQTISTLDENFDGKSYCADVHISSDGKFVYGSNRGENTIVVFKTGIDGTLSLAGRFTCGGDWPRNFVIDPTGKYLLAGNQRSDNISIFRLDGQTGLPEGPVSNTKMKGVACLKVLP